MAEQAAPSNQTNAYTYVAAAAGIQQTTGKSTKQSPTAFAKVIIEETPEAATSAAARARG